MHKAANRSLALNKRTPLHLELLAPKDLYVGFSVIQGARGGRRVDSILQVGLMEHRVARRGVLLTADVM
jgi:hypothetical protein